MILEVLEFPDPGLRNVAEPIEEEEVTEKTRELAHDMLETMYHQPGIDAHVIVEARTLDCEQVEFDSVELEAFCLQHEIDHLDGVLFIDRISRLKRDLYVHRRKKQLRRDREVAGHST